MLWYRKLHLFNYDMKCLGKNLSAAPESDDALKMASANCTAYLPVAVNAGNFAFILFLCLLFQSTAPERTIIGCTGCLRFKQTTFYEPAKFSAA